MSIQKGPGRDRKDRIALGSATVRLCLLFPSHLHDVGLSDPRPADLEVRA